MIRNFILQLIALLGSVLLPLLVSVYSALANVKITETEYSTSLSEATGIVRIIVAILGGLIAVLGIVLAFRGIGGKADVELSLSEHKKMAFKKISQGVVIVIIGAAILVGAIYLLPEKRKESVVTVEEVHIEREGGKESMHMMGRK